MQIALRSSLGNFSRSVICCLKYAGDSLWFPSQEEYYEYNYYRLNSHISIAQIDASSFKLTVNLPREKFFYYPSTTINLPGISMYDIVSIEGNDALTGLSYADYKVEGICFVGSIGRIGLVSFYEILGVFKQVFPTVDIEHDTVFVVSIR